MLLSFSYFNVLRIKSAITYIKAETKLLLIKGLIQLKTPKIPMLEGEVVNDDEIKKMKNFYQKELDRSVDGMDYLYVGLSMIDNAKFDDKAWIHDVFLLSIEKIKNSQDCTVALDTITKKYCFEDTTWTRKLFETAFNKLNTVTSLTSLAEYIIDAKYLGDKIWAKEVYNLAYQYAEEEMEYIMLAASVQKNLKDTVFSDEILQKAKNLSTSEENFQFLYEVFFDETDIGK